LVTSEDPDFQEAIRDLQGQVRSLGERVASLEGKVDVLIGSNSSLVLIIKWIVTPLLVIVGALVGVKIAFPGA